MLKFSQYAEKWLINPTANINNFNEITDIDVISLV